MTLHTTLLELPFTCNYELPKLVITLTFELNETSETFLFFHDIISS